MIPKIKIGDLIGGRYEVRAILGGKGKSGMGIVFICFDQERDSSVVLKTFQDRFMKSKFIVDAFKHEALAWIILDYHPNIVRAQYVIKVEGKIYIALEYIEPDEKGRNTLKHFIKERVSLQQALSWSIQLCRGMEHAQSRGLASHHDIKPANLMISKEGILKICDFGLARIWDQEEQDIENLSELTMDVRSNLSFICVHEGKIVTGTADWMAPERYGGKGDIRSDIYSFGAVMHQMVNLGKLPFSEQSLKPYILNIRKQPSETVKTEFYPIIERCLQTKPENRYQDFKELRVDLEALHEKEYGKFPSAPEKKEELEAWEHENKGISFHTLGLMDMAIREIWKGIQLRPNHAETHFFLGMAYLDKGVTLDIAIVSFQEALKYNPNLFEAHYGLGKAYSKKEMFEDAINEYQETINFKPSFFKAHHKLGKLFESMGNFQEALKSYKRIVNSVITKEDFHFKIINKKIKEIEKKIKKMG